jgi:hypothetical protein
MKIVLTLIESKSSSATVLNLLSKIAPRGHQQSPAVKRAKQYSCYWSMTIVRQAGKHSFRRHGGPTPVSRGLKLRCRSHISVCLFSHFGAIQFLLFPSARHFLFQPGGAGVAAGPSWSFFFFFSSSTFFRNKIKHRRKIRKISPRLPSVLTWNLMPDSTSVNL